MKEELPQIDLGGGHSRQLKHERLKARLIDEMVAGHLKSGELLPSENQLAKEWGITRVTVRQAMASLENDGLIRRVQGKGTFVSDDVRRKLKRGQDIFALIVPETREGFYPSLLHGFEDAASRIHHQAIVCATGDNVERQGNVILQLLDKKVGGVAINPTGPEPTPAFQVRMLQEQGIPVVFCHQCVEGIAAPLLAIPFRDVGLLAGEVIAKHGHRRAAYIATYRCLSSQACEEGLCQSLRGDGQDIALESVYLAESSDIREEDVWAALQKLFTKPNPPTAIFTTFDSTAEMIYLLLPRLGLRVPEDVSLLGFGGAWRQGALTRRLSSVVVDEIATGRQAVSWLHEMRCGERPIDDNTEAVMGVSISNGITMAAPRECS